MRRDSGESTCGLMCELGDEVVSILLSPPECALRRVFVSILSTGGVGSDL